MKQNLPDFPYWLQIIKNVDFLAIDYYISLCEFYPQYAQNMPWSMNAI